MMKKIILISLGVFFTFLVQVTWCTIIGGWLTPNLLLLISIFFNLYFGIRYGLFSALLAGLLMDSFSISPFGTHLFLFISCTFMTVVLKQYLYHMGSSVSRSILVLLVCLMYIFSYLLLSLMNRTIDFPQIMKVVLIPDIVLTTLISNYLFIYLKRCASKLSA